MTKAPEHWDASWENNLIAARLADDAGLEFLLPVDAGTATAVKPTPKHVVRDADVGERLLAATRDISVFGTLHVAFINPVFAAKQS